MGEQHTPPVTFPAWLVLLADRIAVICGLKNFEFNSANANLYNDGTESLYWHSDDEDLFKTRSSYVTIVSLTVGAARSFAYKKKYGDKYSITLSSGDILVMTGCFQEHYQHAVPESNSIDPRFNLTFRFLHRHLRECTKTNTTKKLYSGLFFPDS